MASFKKFWFVTNWVNKKTSPSQPDCIESLNTSSTQLSDAVLLPTCVESEQRVKVRCAKKTRSGIKATARRKFRSDLKKTKAPSSSPSLVSTKYAAPSSVLQKSSNKAKKANVAEEKTVEDVEKTVASEIQRELTAEKVPPKSGDHKVSSTRKKVKAAKTAAEEPEASEEEVPVKIAVEEADEGNDNVAASAETSDSGESNATSQDSETAEAVEKPETGDTVPSEDGEETKSEDTPSDPEEQRTKRETADEEEPVAGEEGTGEVPGKRKKRRSVVGEEPVVAEEATRATRRPRSRPTRARRFQQTTTESATQTPFTTASPVLSPRPSVPRKPFSRPLTFSTQSSNFESLNEIERHHSLAHEQYLQRAWALMDAPLRKMLQTPLKTPEYLRDPPELGSSGTLTSEMRRDLAKRRIEAMKRPSLELIKNPMMLEMIQSKTNKCEILRKKYSKKEPIISAFFEQHFDRFQRPPFRNVRAMRKCV